MGQEQEFKIRTLPRKEVKRPANAAPKAYRRELIYVGACAIAFLAVLILVLRGAPFAKVASAAKGSKIVHRTALSSVQDPLDAHINTLVRDSLMKEEMLKQKRKMENLKARVQGDSQFDAAVLPEDMHSYGVHLDQDDTSERLYNDLDTHPAQATDWLPDDRINARLAKRKWVNDTERAERIQFVRNFIRSAYDRGYEVEIDQNLVVVGVHKITGRRHIDIDQVMDKLAKEGL
jgi:hypothetical protein